MSAPPIRPRLGSDRHVTTHLCGRRAPLINSRDTASENEYMRFSQLRMLRDVPFQTGFGPGACICIDVGGSPRQRHRQGQRTQHRWKMGHTALPVAQAALEHPPPVPPSTHIPGSPTVLPQYSTAGMRAARAADTMAARQTQRLQPCRCLLRPVPSMLFRRPWTSAMREIHCAVSRLVQHRLLQCG